MLSQLFLTSLIVQCAATLFLFLVFLILFRYSRQPYFAYWTAGWAALSVGLLALLVYFLGIERGHSWLLLAVYEVSVGVTALLALFARFAFRHGRRVDGRSWLLLLPVCAFLAASALGSPQVHALSTLPRHLFLAISLWASGFLFWQLARHERRAGAGFLAVAFACWGLQQAHYATAFLLLHGRAPYLEWVSFADTAIVIFVALGMIHFALEEERARLLDSRRKLEISEQLLKDLAMRDPLTGLFNRRHFDQVAPQIEAQARRMDFSITVFVVDLNHFKETNDRDGHLRGDQLLRAFAEFLGRETRAADLCFRWGGDEFLLLMMDLSLDHAEAKGEELRERWDAVRRELATEVSLAVGWALLEEDGLDAAIRRADRRMYGDKRAGRPPRFTPSP
jgi:diguanylate cyclase (GGDEF)-like protein